MTLLYCGDQFLQHETGNHPENAHRIKSIHIELASRGLIDKCTRPAWDACPYDWLHLVHTPEYLDSVKRRAAEGGGQIERDTVVSPASFKTSQLAAGAACDAVRRVLAGEDTTAFCAIRPPGHHALKSAAMGFCLINNVAVAARYATEVLGIQRVLIVDFDVHHGNGTQATFWEDPRVGFYSMHRWPFYPGTGDGSETGAGKGLGTTFNLPLAFGVPRETLLARFEDSVSGFAKKLRPELILLSAGFDAHHRDPVGSLGLISEDFIQITRHLRGIANEYAQGRVVSLLEGGYHPAALAQSVAFHLQTLLEP